MKHVFGSPVEPLKIDFRGRIDCPAKKILFGFSFPKSIFVSKIDSGRS